MWIIRTFPLARWSKDQNWRVANSFCRTRCYMSKLHKMKQRWWSKTIMHGELSMLVSSLFSLLTRDDFVWTVLIITSSKTNEKSKSMREKYFGEHKLWLPPVEAWQASELRAARRTLFSIEGLYGHLSRAPPQLASRHLFYKLPRTLFPMCSKLHVRTGQARKWDLMNEICLFMIPKVNL